MARQHIRRRSIWLPLCRVARQAGLAHRAGSRGSPDPDPGRDAHARTQLHGCGRPRHAQRRPRSGHETVAAGRSRGGPSHRRAPGLSGRSEGLRAAGVLCPGIRRYGQQRVDGQSRIGRAAVADRLSLLEKGLLHTRSAGLQHRSQDRSTRVIPARSRVIISAWQETAPDRRAVGRAGEADFQRASPDRSDPDHAHSRLRDLSVEVRAERQRAHRGAHRPDQGVVAARRATQGSGFLHERHGARPPAGTGGEALGRRGHARRRDRDRCRIARRSGVSAPARFRLSGCRASRSEGSAGGSEGHPCLEHARPGLPRSRRSAGGGRGIQQGHRAQSL